MKSMRALACALVLACGVLGGSSSVLAKRSSLPLPVADASSRLYITFHGGKEGINTVQSYGFDGSLLDNNVLHGDTKLSELRSMLLQADGSLLVANAYKNDSRIVKFSACGADGKRKYMGDFTGAGHTFHPYGLAFGADRAKADNVLWVSNQDSFDITQFGATGNFQSQVRSFGQEQLRSIAYNNNSGLLYVTNEDENAVLVYDTSSHTWNAALSIPTTKPVGLFMDTSRNVLFVGSDDTDVGYVYAYDVTSGNKLVQTFTHGHMKHPTGIVAIGDAVYILAQKEGNLAQFSYSTGQHVGYVVETFDDNVEQIIISPC